MTKLDKKESSYLTERQKKAIPHLIISATNEEGRKRARISRNTLYTWLKDPIFRNELQRQRNIVVDEALEILKANVTKAVNVLVSLLDNVTDNDRLVRLVCNDIISHTLKAKEIDELIQRIETIEKKLNA